MAQISTCGLDLHAVNQAYTKNSQGYAATGVTAVSCHHAEQPDSAPKPEGSLEVGVKVGFLDVL